MSKGLEALERLYTNYVHVFKARENGKTQLVHDLNTIKKELKALEIIKELFVFQPDKFYPFIWKELSKPQKEKIDLLKDLL